MTQRAASVLLCRCANSDHLPRQTVEGLVHALSERLDVVCVDDLCGLAARGDGFPAEISGAGKLTVIACRERAVRWLLAAAGIELAPQDLDVLDMRSLSSVEILARLGNDAGRSAPALRRELRCGDGWVPWFPVIDRERCTNCKQCLSFCLFGVYRLGDDGSVAVVNPRACKTNCPACARICPQVAIIFPKYSDGPISGAPIRDEDHERQRVAVDVAALLGDDAYVALAQRRRRARGKLLKMRREARELAEREQAACAATDEASGAP